MAIMATVLLSCETAVNVIPTDTTKILNDTSLLHAYITDYYPNTNFKNDGDFSALGWKDGLGVGYIGRTIFKIDLSYIPQSATVTSAQLYLNYNPTPIHYSGVGHNKDSGSNACSMQRITQNWKYDSVTWNNQPTVRTSNPIILDSSSNKFQNYVVDMTAEINDMVKNPTTNFGFLLRLQIESPIRVLGFASGGSSIISHRPVLKITYKMP